MGRALVRERQKRAEGESGEILDGELGGIEEGWGKGWGWVGGRGERTRQEGRSTVEEKYQTKKDENK